MIPGKLGCVIQRGCIGIIDNVASTTKGHSQDTLVTHARQSGAAENLVHSMFDGIASYRNPVIRLLAADGLLHSEERLRLVRRAAVADLRAQGWTWERIGSMLDTTRQHAWQIGQEM